MLRFFLSKLPALVLFAICATDCVLAAVLPSSPQDASTVSADFRAANDLMEQKKYPEALLRYQEVLKLDPNQPSALFNGGMAAYFSQNYAVAVDLWKRLKALDPDDWRTRAKLIQAYQALGKTADRDAERSALFALWKAGKSPDLAKQVEYCREQFEVAGSRVMVFEYFELKGERALRYVFSVLDADGKHEQYRYSLGSYETTNAVWRESTKPPPPKDQRLFHLDGYFPGGHATYGFFEREPSYDETRTMVIAIIKGEKKPVSSTVYGSSPSAPEKPKP